MPPAKRWTYGREQVCVCSWEEVTEDEWSRWLRMTGMGRGKRFRRTAMNEQDLV